MAFAFSLINTQNIAARIAAARLGAAERALPRAAAGRRAGRRHVADRAACRQRFSRPSRQRRGRAWRLADRRRKGVDDQCADGRCVSSSMPRPIPPAARRASRHFLVDAREPGFVRLPPYELMGGHAIGAGGFRLEGLPDRRGRAVLCAGPGFQARPHQHQRGAHLRRRHVLRHGGRGVAHGARIRADAAQLSGKGCSTIKASAGCSPMSQPTSRRRGF